MTDVVATREQAAALEREPLVVLEPLTAFLDAHGLGGGRLEVAPIGDGHSNVTYLVTRAAKRFVLRRPPRGPLAPSTHDVLREARLLAALGAAGARVPDILAVCDDPHVIGAPFYLMGFIEGHVLSGELPAPLGDPGDPQRIADQVVDALIEVHAVDVETARLSSFGRPGGYLERQVVRFRGLLDANATRPLPALERIADWLDENRPSGGELTVVHGDYRLGNTIISAYPTPRLAAILDWEMATLGDPLADVGYLTATWAQADDLDDPMLDLSRVTRGHGFPGRAALADRYAQRTGRDLGTLRWYQALAIWKAAIFLEGNYKRYLTGSTDDPYFEGLEAGVPVLARRAARIAGLARQ